MESIATFLAGSSIVAVIIIQLLKKFIKETIEPRWGDLGIQIVLFVVAVIIALVGFWIKLIPGEIIKVGSQIFAGAIVIYQVLGKAIIQKAVRNKLDSDDK